MFDFFLALLINIKGAFSVFFWGGVVSIVICLIAMFCMMDEKSVDEDDWAKWRRWKKYSVILCLITAPFHALPDTEDLWHVRISMLKFHAVSPDNIEKFAKNGMPHIERVAKKIECRYLGCPDSEKKELGIDQAKTTSVDATEKVVEKVADKIVEEVTK